MEKSEHALGLGMKQLKVGESYLHHNGFFVREILGINGEDDHWQDATGVVRCSRKNFVRQCVEVATQADLEKAAQDDEEDRVSRKQPIPSAPSLNARKNALRSAPFRTS